MAEKNTTKKTTKKVDDEAAVLAAIAAMPKADRSMGERLHAIIKANASELTPKTWYGMPAYAKDGKVVCFFRSAEKFKERYMTFGFNDTANLDEGAMWPISFALKELTATEETKIVALLKKAGIDMTTSAPFELAMKKMNRVMDEIEQILDRRKK